MGHNINYGLRYSPTFGESQRGKRSRHTIIFSVTLVGDEMNLFPPQSISTSIEIAQIAEVSKHIMTARYSEPIIKLKQEAVVGSFQMTEKDVEIDWHDVMNIMMNCKNIDYSKIEKKNIGTHELYSMIIPEKINIIDGEKLQIVNGVLKKGIINGNVMNDKILTVSWDRHGPGKTKDFIDNSQRLVVNYLLQDGFTVGLNDCIIAPEDKLEIVKMLKEASFEVQHLITEIENYPDLLDADTFEKQIFNYLSNAIKGNIVKMVLSKTDSSNHFYSMIASKAKGKELNLGQIIGGLGQDVLKYARIEKRVNNRTIVHFCQYDDTAEARGNIANSYYDGLEPHEYYFHQMTGREGLIDTAIKSVTGDTHIIIIENDNLKEVCIGDWIDTLLRNDPSNIKLDDDRELLELHNNVYIPTVDLKGNTSWGNIKAITRHNPGKALYEVKTSGGRKVIVTESHSLLIWNELTQEFERRNSDTVKVGDYMPVTHNLEIPEQACDGYFYKRYKNSFDLVRCDDNITYDNVINLFKSMCNINNCDDKRVINNVTLDEIVSIEEVDIFRYPKVYDLTVPSTLNFGLANGLHVVDTADTGYLQRKLIKGMEDVHIAYDGTARSGNNIIVQALYGDSHLDQVKQQAVKINILSWGNKKLEEQYVMSTEQMNETMQNNKYNAQQKKEFKELNEEILDIMKQFRDDIRNIQSKARLTKVTVKETYFQPANYPRIIEDAKNSTTIDNTQLDPLYIISELDRLMDPRVCRLVCLIKTDDEHSMKYKNQLDAKYLFRIALYEYLAPKRCLYEYKFNKEKFDKVIDEIITSFNNATVQPGEMVGILGAQSQGEPLTQMSVLGSSELLIKHNDEIKKVKIGELIDTYIVDWPEDVYTIPQHQNSVEAYMNDDLYVCGVQQNETVTWNKVSHISRHPANGSLVKITTNSGRTVTTTKSHNFLIRSNDGIVPIRADQLSVNTRIPVARNIKYQYNNGLLKYGDNEYILDELFGWFCGIYLADGNVCNNDITITKDAPYIENKMREITTRLGNTMRKSERQCEYGLTIYYKFNNASLASLLSTTFMTGSFNKKVPAFVHNSNVQFIRGLIRGYIDGDGNFSADRNLIRVGSRSKELIEDMSLLLSYFGIFATNYGEKKSGNDTPLYCLGIAHKYAEKYLHAIGCDYPEKLANLQSIIAYSNAQHHADTDPLDSIPELGAVIARVSRTINMPNNSRIYGRIEREDRTVGRRTLKKYIDLFIEHAVRNNKYNLISTDIDYLTMIYNGEVVWDKIVSIEELPDNGEFVYDLTVPGNETFMIANQIIVHNTLNTFHSTGSGVAGMQGVPRFRELMSYTKTKDQGSPYMIIYMNKENRTNRDTAHRIASTLKYTILNELAEQMDIIYEPDAKNPDSYHITDDIDADSKFFLNNMSSTNLENMPWLFRVTLSNESVIENEISMLDIKTRFVAFWAEHFSDLSGISSAKIEKHIISKILHGCIMTSYDSRPNGSGSAQNLVIHFRFELSNIDDSILSGIANILLNKFNIKGNEAITKINKIDNQTYISYENEDQEPESIKEWTIYTDGIDMLSIRDFIGIDLNRTYCNSIHEIYITFGIEAARIALIKEFENVFEGSSINYTHIALLADVMTNTGRITSIDRHGINRLDTDPMGRASFEKTIEQLLLASAFNEVDYLRGVSSRIMVGQCIRGGTGLCSILLDVDMVENSEINDTMETKMVGTEFRTLNKSSLLIDLLKKGGAKTLIK